VRSTSPKRDPDDNGLAALVARAAPDMDAIAALLDGLSHADRVRAVLALGKAEQRALFRAAEGRRVRVGDIVPEGRPPLREVVHHGRNSLPAFRRFAKVFCRPDEAAAAERGELWGYNRNAALVETAVGPGFFVAKDHGDDEVVIDYLRLPSGKPPEWPRMLHNDARLSRFVYDGTKDYLRRVSVHVTIGRASRGGRHLPNWFILCREDPE
jgi:hypothetical protein